MTRRRRMYRDDDDDDDDDAAMMTRRWWHEHLQSIFHLRKYVNGIVYVLSRLIVCQASVHSSGVSTSLIHRPILLAPKDIMAISCLTPWGGFKLLALRSWSMERPFRTWRCELCLISLRTTVWKRNCKKERVHNKFVSEGQGKWTHDKTSRRSNFLSKSWLVQLVQLCKDSRNVSMMSVDRVIGEVVLSSQELQTESAMVAISAKDVLTTGGSSLVRTSGPDSQESRDAQVRCRPCWLHRHCLPTCPSQRPVGSVVLVRVLFIFHSFCRSNVKRL
jgi:hypothetical protein